MDTDYGPDMSVTRIPHNGEKGAAAVLVAASLVMLMGFAAVAIDLGAGFNERRQDQTGADTGVLAGAVELAVGPGFTSQDAVEAIRDYIDANIRVVPEADWVACSDSEALTLTAADLGLTPATDCISFETFDHIRVTVPDQETATTFGRVLGFTSLVTRASAEATLQQFPGLGNPPPFAVPAGFSGGDQVCLRTGPPTSLPDMTVGGGPEAPRILEGGGADPCDDTVYSPSPPFFGLLDPFAYFYDDGTIACKRNLNDYFIAAGIDHPISSFEPDYTMPGAPPVLLDGTGCSGAPIPGANTINVNTGLTAQELRCGMLTTMGGDCDDDVPGLPGGGPSANVPARLHSGPHVQSTDTFLGEDMDNKPLWDFFVSPLPASAPASCSNLVSNLGSPGWDYYDKRDELLTCLADWNSGDDPLFTSHVWETPRFAWVPYLHEGSITTDPVHINDFVPVYIQTLYTQVSGGVPPGCDDSVGSGPDEWQRHHAGQAGDCGRDNGNLDRISGIVLDCGMLPEEVCNARPGSPTWTPGGTVAPIIELIK